MGADFYIRSISEPAAKRFRPKFNAAVRKRDQYCKQRVAELVAEGLAERDAEAQVHQEERYVQLQGRVTKLYDELYSAENGYFRDGYNETNLMSMFRLGDFRLFNPGVNQSTTVAELLGGVFTRLADNSNWEIFRSLLDKDNLLSPENAARFLALLTKHEPEFYSQLDNLIEYWRQALGRELSNEDSQGWAQYFDTKYQAFRSFLQKAIELDEAVYVSY